MIKGISRETVPHFTLKEYHNLNDARLLLNEFIKDIEKNPLLTQ